MSVNLTNSGAFAADQVFQQRVSAAIIEHAVTSIATASGGLLERTAEGRLATAVLYDPQSYVRLFAGLCANDATISGCASVVEVTDQMIRDVIGVVWTSVWVVVPGLR